MKINKIKHSHNRYCLDPWICYYKDTMYDTIVNNGDGSLFNHLVKYRVSKNVDYISNYKFRNVISDISKYKGRLFNNFSVYNTSIYDISVYFEDMHDAKKDLYIYINNCK